MRLELASWQQQQLGGGDVHLAPPPLPPLTAISPGVNYPAVSMTATAGVDSHPQQQQQLHAKSAASSLWQTFDWQQPTPQVQQQLPFEHSSHGNVYPLDSAATAASSLVDPFASAMGSPPSVGGPAHACCSCQHSHGCASGGGGGHYHGYHPYERAPLHHHPHPHHAHARHVPQSRYRYPPHHHHQHQYYGPHDAMSSASGPGCACCAPFPPNNYHPHHHLHHSSPVVSPASVPAASLSLSPWALAADAPGSMLAPQLPPMAPLDLAAFAQFAAPAAESGLSPLVNALAMPSPPVASAKPARKPRGGSGGKPSPSRRALRAQVRGASAATTMVPLPNHSAFAAGSAAAAAAAATKHKSYFIFGPHSCRLMVRYVMMESGALPGGSESAAAKYPTDAEIAAALTRDRRPVITKKRWARLQGNLSAIPRAAVAVPELIAPPAVTRTGAAAAAVAAAAKDSGVHTAFTGNDDEVVHKLPRGRRVRGGTTAGWVGIDAGVSDGDEDDEDEDDE
ncbi:hypothetical protein H9P43_006604 [Blastocladiella emersonii ATCC 22665]|nr:hypothetical protein H9P43_006604 [Blastocladiella emersonii ATCC 22665]